jgi:spore germination protein YaaH
MKPTRITKRSVKYVRRERNKRLLTHKTANVMEIKNQQKYAVLTVLTMTNLRSFYDEAALLNLDCRTA